jgi:hypothetical protein
MSEQKVDLSKYSEFWTRPRRVFARRLTEATEYETTVNGLLTTIPAHPGDFEVVLIRADGSLLRKEPFTEQQFKKKFGTGGLEGDLFSYSNTSEDEED